MNCSSSFLDFFCVLCVTFASSARMSGSGSLAYFFRAAIAFSAVFTRSAPTVVFHLL